MMLQQSTLMGALVHNTKNSSRYIVVHDSQFDKKLCLHQMFGKLCSYADMGR
jgi:hypothetical protein